MTQEIKVENLGLIEYKKAWDYQLELFNAGLKAKVDKTETSNRLIVCEHPHVYTLGKNGDNGNLLMKEEFLKTIGAEYFHIERGGDITYHGPGQIVGYPIFDLDYFNLSIKDYIFNLEQAIIDVLEQFDIHGDRLDAAPGVWLKNGQTRKICAIGVKASRKITMHGFAFNVNTDLSYFDYINPCGFTDKGVTSLEKELGAKQDFEKIKNMVVSRLVEIFKI